MGLDDGIPEKTRKKPETVVKSCICKDSRIISCPEHGDKN